VVGDDGRLDVHDLHTFLPAPRFNRTACASAAAFVAAFRIETGFVVDGRFPLASREPAQTKPVGLTNFVSEYGIDRDAMSATGVLMVIPTLIFVWFA
jgi:ABC-type glycerol-3-phosphate transport system permease component